MWQRKLGIGKKAKRHISWHKKESSFPSLPHPARTTRPARLSFRGKILWCVWFQYATGTQPERVCILRVCWRVHVWGVREPARCAQRFPAFYIWFRISAPLRWARWSVNERSVEPWRCPISPLGRLRQQSPSPQHRVARHHPYLLNSRVISSPAGLPHMEPHFCSGFFIWKSPTRDSPLGFLSFSTWFWTRHSARHDECAFDALICSFKG